MGIIEHLKKRKDYKNATELIAYYTKRGWIKDIDLSQFYYNDSFEKIVVEKVLNKDITIDTVIKIINYFFKGDKKNYRSINYILGKIYNNDYFISGYKKNFVHFPLYFKINEELFSKLFNLFVRIIYANIDELSNNILELVTYNLKTNINVNKNSRDKLINIMNNKLKNLVEISNNKNLIISDSIIIEYSLYVNLSEFIFNKETKELIKKIIVENLPVDLKLKLISTMLKHKIGFSNKIIDSMFVSIETTFYTLYLLEQKKAENLIPKNIKYTQEDIATYQMRQWLIYPTELGCEPKDLKIIDNIVIDNYRYYVFSFRNPNEQKKKSMIAVSRGYLDNEKITTKSRGYDFSNFEEISDNYEEQINNIFNTLNEWENN